MRNGTTRIVGKALTVWLVLIVAEILHGIVRGIFLVPGVGELRSNQIKVIAAAQVSTTQRFPAIFVKMAGPVSRYVNNYCKGKP